MTAPFFSILRVRPIRGRAFTKDDEVQGQHRVAILSYGFWQRRFGGAPDVIGKTLVERRAVASRGVLPRDFSYPIASERPSSVFTPVAFTPEEKVRGNNRNYTWLTIGRLQEGVSIQQAHDQMNRLRRRSTNTTRTSPIARRKYERPEWTRSSRCVRSERAARLSGFRDQGSGFRR